MGLPRSHYDFISCLASIHHAPFDTVCKLRDALTPGGVPVILGCYPKKTPIGLAWSLAAVPANAAARLSTAVIDNIHPAAATSPRTVKAPVKQPAIPLSEIRGEAAVLRQCCCPGAAFGPARGGSQPGVRRRRAHQRFELGGHLDGVRCAGTSSLPTPESRRWHCGKTFRFKCPTPRWRLR